MINFPLFAIAFALWLGRGKRVLYAILITIALGLLIMCGIFSAEIIIQGQKGGRLKWSYGDLAPRNYLAKVGLPAFAVIAALAVAFTGQLVALSGIFAIFTMFLGVITGKIMWCLQPHG